MCETEPSDDGKKYESQRLSGFLRKPRRGVVESSGFFKPADEGGGDDSYDT